MKDTGKEKQVERNIAFDLIHRGLAEPVTDEPVKKQYATRQLRARHMK